MNWKKKNSPFAAVRRGQEMKFQKVRELLFGPHPVPKPAKLAKVRPAYFRWSETYYFDSYGYDRKTAVRRWGERASKVNKPGKPEKVFSSAFTFGQALKCRGFVHLGHGAFSTVYAKPGSDRVIKVTHRPDHWIDYCLWGEKNGYAGSLSPKVYSYKMYDGLQGDKFSVSVVERMNKTCNRIGKKEDLWLLDSLLSKYVYSENTMCGLFLDELAPGLADFGLKLKKNFGGLDLHGGNIMVRENGSLCITDPVTYTDGELQAQVYTRLKAKDIETASFGSPTSLAKAIAFIYKLRYKQWYENLYRH